MFNKKLVLVAIFFVSLIAVSAVSASDNITEDIVAVGMDSSNDEILTVADGGTFKDLQDKIDAADEGGTIILENNYTNNGTFSKDGINITKSITIEGNGVIIDASNYSRIFNIDASKNVILNNITFTGGNASTGGAIIFNNDISDCVISNCEFILNNAIEEGGAIYFKAIRNVTIKNTLFSTNVAGGYGGGAIYVYGISADNLFENVTFSNNKVLEWDGGAINFYLGSYNTKFKNSKFLANIASYNGGAINSDDDFVNNSFYNVEFVENTAVNSGGAFSVSTLSDGNIFENVNFTSNQAVKSSGGAINFIDLTSNNIFNNTRFYSNHAGSDGGAISSVIKGDFVNNAFYNTQFANNNATNNGGALYFWIDVENNLFNGTTFTSNEALNGGAIYANGNILNTTIADSEFKDNIAIVGTNNIGLNRENPDFILINVTPEYLGPYYVGYLSVLNVTDNITYGETVEIILNVFGVNHFPLNNGTVSVIVNNQTYTANVENGNAILKLSDVVPGKYDVNVTYDGNDYLASAPVKFNVSMANSNVTIEPVATVFYGNNVTVYYNVENRTEVKVLIVNKTKLITTNYKLFEDHVDIYNLAAGNYSVIIVNMADDKYKASWNHTNFTIEKAPSSVKIMPIDDVVYPNDVFVDFQVLNATTVRVVAVRDDGTVVFDQSFDVYQPEVSLTLKLWGLDAGKYQVTILNAETENYTFSGYRMGFTVEKAYPYMKTTITPEIKAGDEGVVIQVVLPEDATGRVMLSIDGEVVSQMGYVLINGTANISVPYDFLTAGRHSYLVSYDGDDNYESDIVYKSFNVAAQGSEISVDCPVTVNVGEDVNITVRVANASGTVELYLNDNLVDSGDLDENSTHTFVVSGLAAGEYYFTVIYTGDENHEKAFTNCPITVEKAGSAVKIMSIEDVVYPNNAFIHFTIINATTVRVVAVRDDGTVVFDQSGDVYQPEVSLTLELWGLRAGSYMVAILNAETDKVISSQNQMGFAVLKQDPIMETSITEDIMLYDNNVTIDVTLPKTATGRVMLLIDGEIVSPMGYRLINGAVTIAVPSDLLTPGRHSYVVSYDGDINYLNTVYYATFEVSDKYSSTCIILPVDYTFYPGEATINYVVYNATEVAIQVLTDDYTMIFNKTTVAEDDFYDNITLDGLAAGEYYVVVLNMGNDTVAASSDYLNFIVDKAEAYMKTSITPEIKAGDEGVVIQVVLPENATGRVMLSIDGEVVSQMGYVLINGTANIGVPYDFLTVGGHSYLVSYDGDDNYESAIGYHTFNVAAQDSEISVDCPVTANVGDDINMTVRVANASGTVVLYLDDNFIDAGILDENSTLTFVVRDLVAGDHYFTVVYAGDENHEKAFMNYPITVEKAGSVVRISPIDDVVYPDDVFINFQVLNATTVRVVAVRDDGTVVFDQSGDVYQSEVNLTLKLWGLRPASYMVGILNAETDNVTSSQSQISFAVLKQESIMETSITEDIRIHDENVTINVTLPKSATGRVMLSIDGEMVSQMGYILINGSANITVPYDFLTAGRHVYLVSYDGDDNYEGTFDYATFDVKGKDSSEIYILILDDAIYPGEMNFEYLIFNATEVSIMVIKEDLSIVYKEYIVVNEPVWDSYINLTNLAAGDYIVSINNIENENFTRSSEHARFIVYKAEPNVETTITSDIKPYDENVTIEVVLPEDATGRVMLAIDGEMVSQMGYVLINGTANIAVPYDFLTAGRHVYFVSYDGDDNYAGAVSYSIFNVDAEPSEVNITTPVDFKIGEDANITVDIPGATGDICVIVDGIEKVVPLDENGSAVVTFNVTPGEHSIVVVYSGDETHSPAVKTATFAAVVVPTKFDNVTVENDLNITAILIDSMGDGVANATITYTIGNVTNSIITAANGEFTVPGVAGETIIIDYAGDDVMLPTSITITLPELVESYFNITGGVITLNGYAVDTKAGEEGMTYATELLDSEGKPISGVKIQFAVNDKIYGRTTDEKGSFTPYKLNMVRAGRYTMAFYFGGNENYISAFGSVCVDLDKKPIAISASAKTYKASATKSYTVTLSTEPCSSSDGKAHLSSGKKVTLLVNGKTYTGKTDSNGKVTFKLTNLSKKGVYTAKIGFDGDNTYESATKSVKITIE